MESNQPEISKEENILKEKLKRKLPEKTIKKIFLNILFAIIIMLYFFCINIIYVQFDYESSKQCIQICSGIFLLIGLIYLEIAYKKDSDSKMITAIELIVISIYSLSILHIIRKYNFEFKLYLTASSYICAIYYVLKSIIIYTQSKRKILLEASDVKEIVKKEEPVKKEATKKAIPTVNKNPKRKSTKKVEEKTEEKLKKRTTKKKAEEKPKKRTATKKKTETEEKTHKKRAAKKKTETKIEEKPKKKTTTKKKEVKVND